MNPPAPPEDAAIAGPGERVRRAALGGLLAYAGLAAAGLALGLTEYAMSRAFHLWSWVKIGLLYAVAACGVAVHVTGSAVGSSGSGAAPPFEIHLDPMLLLGLAGWLLVRAGLRASADPAAGRRDAAVCVVAVALGFAVPASLSSLLVTLRFPEAGIVGLRPVLWQAAAFPVALGLASAAAGVRLHRSEGRVRGWLAGGWTAFATAIVLAFAGFLVVAAFNPSATAGYARIVGHAGRFGPLLVVHHVLLLPNQSVGILAPSMGGCLRLDDLDLAGRERSEFARLCLDGFHRSKALSDFVDGDQRDRIPLPLAYRLFVLVPLAATVAGGRRAARGAIGLERVVRAGGAGVVFAALVGAGSWLAAVGVPFGAADTPAVFFHLGPPPLVTAAIALIWGVLGGLAGGLLPQRPVQVRPGEPELPSPTSVK